jgi:membrane-associated phospholipid phosphatase
VHAFDSTNVSNKISISDTILKDIKSIGSDFLLMYSSPLRFTSSDWLITGGVIITDVSSMYLLDEIMSKKFLEGHNGTKDKINEFGNYFGSTIPNLIVSGGVYLSGLIFNSYKLRTSGLHVFQASLYSGLLNIILKGVIGRERPYGGEGPFIFQPFSSDNKFNSHPSGHSTMAFALASSLSCEIDNTFATILLYSAATLTMGSRIYSNMHWFSDTFFGAVIGSAFGYGVYYLNDIPKPLGISQLQVYPKFNGIGMSYNF